MDDNKPVYEEIKPGDVTIAIGGGDYVDMPDGEPIKAHVSRVEKVMGTNFNTKEPEEKVSVSFELDEGDGQGQVYSNWMSKSLHPKATLGKLVAALFGEDVPRNEEGKFDVYEMIGLPVRVYLTKPEDKKGTGVKKQYLDTEKGFVKPSKDQSRVEVEIVDPIPGSEIDEVFSK